MKPFLVLTSGRGRDAVYEPMDVLPPGVKVNGYYDSAYYAVEPYLAHAKPYGLKNDKKAVEIEVYGVARDSLLYKFRGTPELYDGYPVEGWHTCRFDQTTEGWRFVRSVVKVMKVLTAVARKAIVERNKRERNWKAAKAREGREGTCQICEGRQILHPTGDNKGTLVLHGYRRPGVGYTIGNCYGYHRKPFEVACDALTEWVALLAREVADTKLKLTALPSAKELWIDGGWKKPAIKIGPDDHRWDDAMRSKKYELEAELRIREYEHERQAFRLANWKPAAA